VLATPPFWLATATTRPMSAQCTASGRRLPAPAVLQVDERWNGPAQEDPEEGEEQERPGDGPQGAAPGVAGAVAARHPLVGDHEGADPGQHRHPEAEGDQRPEHISSSAASGPPRQYGRS